MRNKKPTLLEDKPLPKWAEWLADHFWLVYIIITAVILWAVYRGFSR